MGGCYLRIWRIIKYFSQRITRFGGSLYTIFIKYIHIHYYYNYYYHLKGLSSYLSYSSAPFRCLNVCQGSMVHLAYTHHNRYITHFRCVFFVLFFYLFSSPTERKPVSVTHTHTHTGRMLSLQ